MDEAVDEYVGTPAFLAAECPAAVELAATAAPESARGHVRTALRRFTSAR